MVHLGSHVNVIAHEHNIGICKFRPMQSPELSKVIAPVGLPLAASRAGIGRVRNKQTNKQTTNQPTTCSPLIKLRPSHAAVIHTSVKQAHSLIAYGDNSDWSLVIFLMDLMI